MTPDQMKAAAEYAQRLINQNQPTPAEVRNMIAAKFFGEAGIPQNLKRGWAVLEKFRADREKVGYPLPPGGCFVLGVESVVGGCLTDMQRQLAAVLNVPLENITMGLVENNHGGIAPKADVLEPDNWVIPVAANVRDGKQAAKEYVARAVGLCGRTFTATALERVDHVLKVRPELNQPFEPFKEE